MIQTAIRVYHPESSHGFKGVQVDLSYCPPRNKEVWLARGRTDRQGIVRLSFAETRLRILGQPPQSTITVVINLNNQAGREDYRVNRTLSVRSLKNTISIPLSLTLAAQLGYYRPKPQRTSSQKADDWCKEWSERLAKLNTSTDRDGLCFSRLILDMLTGVHQPQNELQKEAARRLSQQLSNQQLSKIADYATTAKQTLQNCSLPGVGTCNSVQDFVQSVFFSPEGSGYGLYQAMAFRAPDPEANLATLQKGLGFPLPFAWDKDCETWYQQGQLTGQAKDDMDQYYPSLKVLAPPSVNRIEVWDPGLSNNIRIGHVPEKELELLELDVQAGGVRSTAISMDVELDDEHCLVMEEDENGRQVLVVDVKPGQKIRLMGSGFVSGQANLTATMREWTVLPDGRLQPQSTRLPLPGFDGAALDVYGSINPPMPGETPHTYVEDLIVFVWPEAASREGLYQITLTFKNESDYVSSAVQNPNDCSLSLGREDVHTQTLYFAVLPPVTARRARVIATRVECIDETNPEEIGFIPLADDVAYTAQATLSRLLFDAATQQPADASTVLAPVSRQHLFWEDGTHWNPNLQTFPDGNNHFQFLQLDELVFVMLRAVEVEGDLDRAIAHAIAVAIMIAIIVVLSAVIVAVVVILVEAGIVTMGLAELILAPVAIALIKFLLDDGFDSTLATIENLITAAVSGEDTLLSIVVGLSGQEIAHQLSLIRFHRILFKGEHPLADEQVSSSFEDGSMHNVFRSKALGGDYRFHLKVETS